MTKKLTGDIDIDCYDRLQVLSLIKHIPACILHDDNSIEAHNTGVYIQDVPSDPLTGLASLHYKYCEELGYTKIDFLNISAYEGIHSEEHLQKLIDTEPMWELFQHKEIVEKLPHLSDHFDVVNAYKPKSIEELAEVLALIRPAKRALLGKSRDYIQKKIWEKGLGEYSFKRSHAISYSLMIVVKLNLIVEQLENSNDQTTGNLS